MFSSVRTRLTLWYTAILGLILTVFALAVNSVISHRLDAELESSLASTAEVIAVSLQHEIQEHKGRAPGEAMFATVMKTIHATSFPSRAIAVFADTGLVASKPGIAGEVPPGPSAARANRWANVGNQRLVVRSVYIPAARTTYRIEVSEPADRTRAQIGVFRSVLLVAVRQPSCWRQARATFSHARVSLPSSQCPTSEPHHGR